MTGIIRKYVSGHGYGFIKANGDRNIWFHIRNVHPEGTTPCAGERVEFEPDTTYDGRPKALSVVLTDR